MTEQANKKEWYVVNTYAGHENRVKDNLEKRLETMGISDNLFRIVVAEETQIERKNHILKSKINNSENNILYFNLNFLQIRCIIDILSKISKNYSFRADFDFMDDFMAYMRSSAK